MTVRNFKEDLEHSHELSDALNALYHRCFLHLDQIEIVTDLKLQRLGVDKILTLKNGKEINIDEKIRDKDWGDFLLEEYSVVETRKVGWLGPDKLTDYIVYVVKPTRKVYILPFLLLQKAWCKYYRQWANSYRVPNASTHTEDGGVYHTSNLAVPKKVLFTALFEANEFDLDYDRRNQ